MKGDPESLYLQLGQLVAEMPALGGNGPITPEIHRWLGRAVHLVKSMGDAVDIAIITVATDGLNSILREQNAHQIMAVLHRSLAAAEANAPASARGAFIAVGASFDALQAIGKVLSTAKQDALIVDPYMDANVLTDFACTAPEGVGIRLLADSASTKQSALEPAARRWMQQFGASRPLEVRLSEPRSLHDRLIILDRSVAWSLTQSLKDFAGRSPASVLRVANDISQMKANFYEQIWKNATGILNP